MNQDQRDVRTLPQQWERAVERAKAQTRTSSETDDIRESVASFNQI